jgi:CheY-like chemotaxis protein
LHAVIKIMAIILLVDDDPLQAFVRKTALEKSFPDVRRVSGAEALCLIEQSHFSAQLALVISGTHMPGLSGSDFVAEISSRLPWMPVLVLGNGPDTGRDSPNDLIHFVPSPVSGEELSRLSRQMIALHKASAA